MIIRRHMRAVAALSLILVLRLAAAENAERLAQKCRNGNPKDCTKLTQVVKTAADFEALSGDPILRLMVIASFRDRALLDDVARTDPDPKVREEANRLLGRPLVCDARDVVVAGLRRGGNVSVSVHVSLHSLIPQGISSDTERLVQESVLDVVESGLRALGLTPVLGNGAESAIKIEVTGMAKGDCYFRAPWSGSGPPNDCNIFYNRVSWAGAITLAHGEGICREPLGYAAGGTGPESVTESETNDPNTAPLWDTVDEMLGPAIIDLVEYLGGTEALARLAETKDSPAVELEEDQVMVKTFTEDTLLNAAVDKLSDQGVLADIARNAGEPEVRCQAVAKLTDQAALTDIAKTDREESVRWAAESRLKQLVR